MAELAPWLTQQADPIGSFLKGAQAGGIIASTRQRQQSLNMEVRLNEARMQEIALDAKLKAASYDYTMQQRAAEADLASAYSAIGDLEGGWSNPDAIKVLAQVGVSHPAIIGSQLWQHGQENIFKATTLKNQAAQIESLNNYRIEQERGKNLRAQEANDVKLQIEQAKMDLAADPNNAQNQFKLANLYARLQGLDIAAGNLQQREAGTELRRNAAVQGAVTKEADLKEKGFTPTVPLMPPGMTGAPAQPQGAAVGQPLVTPTARPLTTAAVTQQQESLIAAHSALSQASKLEPLINSGTFGPAAFVGSLVIDKGLANIYPELLNKDRVEARVVAAGLRAATVKAVRSDSNITETEREDIIDDIPSPKKFLDSPARALVQLKTINAGIIDRAVRAARNLKQPVDSILAPIGDYTLIKSLFQTGAITEEEAKDWSRTHLPAQ